MKADERAEIVADRMRRPWALLSSLDKELLVGTRPDSATAAGWQKFEEIKLEQLQGKRPPQNFELSLARYITKYYAPDFYKDWLFSKQPLVRRLQTFTPVKKSAYSTQWNQIFKVAVEASKYLADPDYNKTEVREQWQTYARDSLIPWAQSQPGFANELARFGGAKMIYDLLNT